MTAFWDDFAQVALIAQEGGPRAPHALDALRELVEACHDYDHAQGGHVLDSAFRNTRAAQAARLITCEHRWSVKQAATATRAKLLECQKCDYTAAEGWLVAGGFVDPATMALPDEPNDRRVM